MARRIFVQDRSVLTDEELEALARARVSKSKTLSAYSEIIFTGRQNWRQHLHWIIDGKIKLIVDWANDEINGVVKNYVVDF